MLLRRSDPMSRLAVRGWAAALCLAAGAAVGRAEAAEPPTGVAAQLFFNSIRSVESATETFDADFYLALTWHDPLLANAASGAVDWTEIWQPAIESVNSQNMTNGNQYDGQYVYELTGRGRILLIGRYAGTFSAPMNLRHFPFDRQVLPIVIESSLYDQDRVRFGYRETSGQAAARGVAIEAPAGTLSREIDLPEWRIASVKAREVEHFYRINGRRYSQLRVEIEVVRRAGFYVWRVIMVNLLIVALACLAFFSDPGDLSTRLGMSITLFLAAVASTFVTASIVPRISYLTLLDYFLLGCYFVIFLVAVENIAAYALRETPWGKRLDRVSRAAFPLGFALFNAFLWAPILAERLV
jgi:hypothetical protein